MAVKSIDETVSLELLAADAPFYGDGGGKVAIAIRQRRRWSRSR